MKRNNAVNSVIKGIAAGAVVGTAAYMMSGSKKKHTMQSAKRNAGKALRAVGSVVENVSYMLK